MAHILWLFGTGAFTFLRVCVCARCVPVNVCCMNSVAYQV